MANEFMIETVSIKGKKYIDIAGLSLNLREMSEKETNKDVQKYMKFLSDEFLKMIISNEKD